MVPDYESVIVSILDWLESHNGHQSDLSRIGLYGWSFGSYLSLRAAAYDKRIGCVIGHGALGYLDIRLAKKSGPIWLRDLMHVYGMDSVDEAETLIPEVDIKKTPAIGQPLLIIQGGEDRILNQPWFQKDYILDWARGEKDVKYYPDGDHCCSNYFDEVIPFAIDWLDKHLNRREANAPVATAAGYSEKKI